MMAGAIISFTFNQCQKKMSSRVPVFLLAAVYLVLVPQPDLYAQTVNDNRASVTGTVLDTDGTGLQAATAALYALPDSSLVSGAATDDQGMFLIGSIRPGSYFVRVSFIGYTTTDTPTVQLVASQTYKVEDISLSADGMSLSAVNVDAERALIEVQPDKTVLNVQGTINATGSNGLELLKKSPGVVVDNNDNIILSGKNGVQIYIDGKPSPLSTEDIAAQLRSMQSSEIDAIEIITNPGARYDAEGNAGIINIRLRRDMSLGFNSTLDLGYAQGANARYNASSTFNFRTSKFNTFGSYAFSGGDSEGYLNLYRIQNNVLFDQKSISQSSGPSNTFRLGSDFFLGENATLGLLVTGYVNDADRVNSSRTPITDLTTNSTSSVLEAISDNDGVRRNVFVNGNFRWDNRKGITTNADADFGLFYNGSVGFQPNLYRNPNDPSDILENVFASRSPTDIAIYAAKVDHERMLGSGKLGFGTKVSSVETDNVYQFFSVDNNVRTIDVDRSNDFVFRETIAAGYANYSGSSGALNYSGGVRAEYTGSKGELTAMKPSNNDTVTRDYVDIFPSAGLSVQANQNNQVRLNYSRRIDRPSYGDLNPFEFKLDELSFARGNPFLQPQYTHSVSLTHTYKYVLNTSVSYSKTNDFFARISDSTDVSRTVLETINMDFQKVLSATVSLPYSPITWWNTYTSLTGYNTRNRAELGAGRTVDVEATVGSLYHQSTFTLPKNWTFELSGWFNSPSLWGAVYKVDSNFSIDTGVRKRLFDGRADVKVAVSDVFKTAPWRGVQEFSGFYVDASGGWESRVLRVSFSYLFGNSQVKKVRERSLGTEDEASRVN